MHSVVTLKANSTFTSPINYALNAGEISTALIKTLDKQEINEHFRNIFKINK